MVILELITVLPQIIHLICQLGKQYQVIMYAFTHGLTFGTSNPPNLKVYFATVSSPTMGSDNIADITGQQNNSVNAGYFATWINGTQIHLKCCSYHERHHQLGCQDSPSSVLAVAVPHFL